jgi:gliding motility-associated-like protein
VITVEENGCTSQDTVSIIVSYEPVIFVPNIFSPNGDNNNDVLYVRGRGIDYVTFYVYDRWGEKVFESTRMEDGWDGTFRGKPMNPAVFVYYVEATFLDGTSTTLKGDVTLIR